MNIVDVCQKIFSITPIFLQFLTAIILLLGLMSFLTQILKTKAFLRNNLQKKISTPPTLQSVIDYLKLKGSVDLIEDVRNFSFCYGIIKPRIALSTGLLGAIDKHELKAVLLHESYHLKNHDPLKIILAQTTSLMFFFIPILKEIQQYFALSKEIAADNMAIKYGDKSSLVSVLRKLLVSPAPYFNGIAALASLDGLEKRILYLINNQKKVTFSPSLVNVFLSTIIIVFSFMIVDLPIFAVSAHEGSISCRAEKEINYTKNLLYTPVTTSP